MKPKKKRKSKSEREFQATLKKIGKDAAENFKRKPLWWLHLHEDKDAKHKDEAVMEEWKETVRSYLENADKYSR